MSLTSTTTAESLTRKNTLASSLQELQKVSFLGFPSVGLHMDVDHIQANADASMQAPARARIP
jgi:hypothetical protein